MKTLLLIACLGLTRASATIADQIKYPIGNPNFSIEFPDGWLVQPDEHALHAGPSDKSLYFGILPVPADTDSDKVGEVVGGIVNQMVSELGAGEVNHVEINGIKFFITTASGKSKEGNENVDVSFGFFSPLNDGNEINALIYFSPPDASAKYEKEVRQILASIHAFPKR